MRIPNFPGTYIPGSTVIAIFFPSFVQITHNNLPGKFYHALVCIWKNCFPNPALLSLLFSALEASDMLRCSLQIGAHHDN